VDRKQSFFYQDAELLLRCRPKQFEYEPRAHDYVLPNKNVKNFVPRYLNLLNTSDAAVN